MVSKVAARLAGAVVRGKLATAESCSHDMAMRGLAGLAPFLILAACAPKVQTPPVAVAKPAERPGATMIGFAENDLISRFGQPTFKVKEGQGTKLQWSRGGCVLDAYLYPPEGRSGGDRVMHVDSRAPSGADLPINACLDLLAR